MDQKLIMTVDADGGVDIRLEHPLAEKAKKLPEQPGVYLFHDAAGEVIYVGKAVSLKNRVRSYFQSGRHAKVLAMLDKAFELTFIVTENEVEALVLESNLIKRHRPRYNIILKDDKSYPYIKVTLDEEYPRVLFSRRRLKDGARYFGPFTWAGAVYETLRYTRTVFPFRSCKKMVPERSRPCLNYHIKRCPGPCTGQVDPRVYRQGISNLCMLLEGRYKPVMRQLKKEMETAAAGLDFEKAAVLRDRLKALEAILVRQRVVSGKNEYQDVIALGRSGESAVAAVLQVRSGRLVGQDLFTLAGAAGRSDNEVTAGFLKQYYSGVATSIPREVILPADPGDEGAVLTAYLRGKAGKTVVLTVPRRGRKKELLELARKNAALGLEEKDPQELPKEDALIGLVKFLGLKELPRRIEGYDASCLQGTAPVAVMVVFQDGKPQKNGYRRFAAGPTGKPDDYGVLREALKRRLDRAREEQSAVEEGILSQKSAKFLPLPDLLLVDGGAGQAAVAQEVLLSFDFTGIPVLGLAKENEWLYRPGRAAPIMIPRDSAALMLLQRVRDEAHRFAIGYHRKRRGRSLRSVLEEIEGIGPVRRRELLRLFPSLEALKTADTDALCKVPGMNRRAADAVKRYFQDAVQDGVKEKN
ncbi:MAG: excinuclease ABC subunit UvrC [Bacillota bacterium]